MPKRNRIYLAVVMLIALGGCGDAASFWQGMSSPTTLDEAEKWVLGEWTAKSEELGKQSQPGYWEYVRFEADGTVLNCTAVGGDDTWGNCRRSSYEVSADRYANTGEDFFRIRIRRPGSTSWSMVAYLIEGRVIEQRITRDGGISYLTSVDFRRGNTHPHAPRP